MVKESAKRYDIDKVYGDKAYDNRKNFNLLDDIEAAERCWQKVDS